MSSDEILKKQFVEDVKGGDNNDETQGTLDEFVEWLTELQVFEETNIQEVDVRTAYETLNKTTPSVNFPDFMFILTEISKKSKTDLGVLKDQLSKLIDSRKKEESVFKDKFKRGVATGKDTSILEWFERNPSFRKMKDKLKFTQEDFQKAYNAVKQKTASSISRENLIQTRDEFKRKFKDFTTMPDFKLDEFVHKMWEYYVSPLSDSEEDESGEDNERRSQ